MAAKADAFIGEQVNYKEEFNRNFSIASIKAEMDAIKRNKQNFEQTFQKIMTQLQSPRQLEQAKSQSRPTSNLRGKKMNESKENSRSNSRSDLFKKADTPAKFPGLDNYSAN